LGAANPRALNLDYILINQWLNGCLLCAGLLTGVPAWAYLDTNAVHHPSGLTPTSSQAAPQNAVDPADQQRATYLAQSIQLVKTALQYYADTPSDETFADLQDAVMDYEAFLP